MARRPRVFAPGLLYHVIGRGNQRQRTFLRDGDYHAYLQRVATYRQKYGVQVWAYCLMPNHVHLLTKSKGSGAFVHCMAVVLRSHHYTICEPWTYPPLQAGTSRWIRRRQSRARPVVVAARRLCPIRQLDACWILK